MTQQQFNKYFLITPLLLIGHSSCKESEKPRDTQYVARPFQSNPLITKYHGSYMVEVKGAPTTYEAEGYALKEDGSAVWMWIENNGQDDAEIKQKKYGSWTVDEDKITISIRGNTGDIVETYLAKNGTLINADNPDRILKSGPY